MNKSEKMKVAAPGNIFVLTQKGYDATPDHIKPEREVGKPVFFKSKYNAFSEVVPEGWLILGWVEEVAK